MLVLPCIGILQDGQLRGGEEVQLCVDLTRVHSLTEAKVSLVSSHAAAVTESTALLMEKEPANLQAQSLAYLIDQRVTRGSCFLPYVSNVTA